MIDTPTPGSEECFHTEYSYQLLSPSLCLEAYRLKKKKKKKSTLFLEVHLTIQSTLACTNNLRFTLAAKYAGFGILVCLGLFGLGFLFVCFCCLFFFSY